MSLSPSAMIDGKHVIFKQPEEVLSMYTWHPQGHGNYTVSIVAASEEEAKAAIDAFIIEETNKKASNRHNYFGWGTSYYQGPTVTPRGVVAIHEND